MGFRFRKSIKAGPLRINLSKSGVGYSVGGKGYRYTKKANGGTRTTTSIPGSGISYVKDSSKKKRGSTMKKSERIEPIIPANPDGNDHGQIVDTLSVTLPEVLLAWFLGYFGAHKFYRKKTGMGCLYLFTMGLFGIGWIGDSLWLTFQYAAGQKGKGNSKKQKYGSYIAAVFCLLVLGSCGGNGNSTVPATEPTAFVTETTAETTCVPTEATVSTTELATIETTEAPTTVPVTEPTTEATTEPKPLVQATSEATEPREEMVWIPTKGGKKYHSRSTCSNMDNPREVTISQAKAKGFTPCKRCH